MKYIIMLLVLASCSHKMIAKNCVESDSNYYVCDSLNGMGK